MSEGSSKRTLVPDHDKAFVSVSGAINTLEDTKDFYLRFVQTFSRAVQPRCCLLSSKDLLAP